MQDYSYSLFVFRRFQRRLFQPLLPNPRPTEACFSFIVDEMPCRGTNVPDTCAMRVFCIRSAGIHLRLVEDNLAARYTNGLTQLRVLSGL
jgi:hypothetical protein